MMKCLGVGGVVGSGEGIFHAPNSDFFSFSCQNMQSFAGPGLFDPLPVLVGLKGQCPLSFEEMHIFFVTYRCNRLYTCIRNIPKSPDNFFYKRKGHGKYGNIGIFWKYFFYTKSLDFRKGLML